MNLKSVIIDLDGTLLNDDKKVGAEDYNTLENLEKQGVFRIVATGRSLYSTSEVLNADFPIDYLIFAAGAGIMNYRTKELIKTFSISKDDVITIAKRLDTLKIDFQVRAEIPDSHKYVYRKYTDYNPDFDRINALYKNYISELIEFENLTNSARFICIAPNDKIVNQIETEFKKFSIIRATSPFDHQSVWMEIYPKGVNKGTSVDFLSKALRVNLTDAVGIGNDYNDIHFLDILDNSFMVNGAPADLKEKYSVTVSNSENPLTAVLEKLI